MRGAILECFESAANSGMIFRFSGTVSRGRDDADVSLGGAAIVPRARGERYDRIFPGVRMRILKHTPLQGLWRRTRGTYIYIYVYMRERYKVRLYARDTMCTRAGYCVEAW